MHIQGKLERLGKLRQNLNITLGTEAACNNQKNKNNKNKDKKYQPRGWERIQFPELTDS